MSPLTPVSAAEIAQSTPAEGAELVAEQGAAYAAELRGCDAADWTRQTECPAWDVRQMSAHVTGAFDEGAHLPVLVRHLRAARKNTQAPMVDALSALQVADREDWSGERIVGDLERLAPKAARRRQRIPGLVRRMSVPGGDLPEGADLGYLNDVIYPRDVWMHRIDTARATGRELAPTAGDGPIVSQVLRDLAAEWRAPAVALTLDGAGGGSWLIGRGEPVAELRGDAVEFMRRLSGRSGSAPTLVDGPEPMAEAVAAARVIF